MQYITNLRYVQYYVAGLVSGQNGYARSVANPVSRSDPSGLCPPGMACVPRQGGPTSAPTSGPRTGPAPRPRPEEAPCTPLWGNWCGPRWSGGLCAGQAGPPAPPIDSTDSCCQEHDNCYASVGAEWEDAGSQLVKECDCAFAKCLACVVYEERGPQYQYIAAWAAAMCLVMN